MRERSTSSLFRSAGAAIALFALTAAAGAPGSTPSRPSTGTSPGLADLTPAQRFVPRQVLVHYRGEPRTRTVRLRPGVGVKRAARALRSWPGVSYAVPNYIATASAATPPLPTLDYPLPNDPGVMSGLTDGVRRGWVFRQWNFLPCGSLCGDVKEAYPFESLGGINAIAAWQHLRDAGHPGAAGVRIAVLDSGIAYRRAKGGYRRSPDFSRGRFTRGYDFVDDDRVPVDDNGHGTHVAGTIGEDTGNGIGVTGLAYKAKLIPVRVLDRNLSGRADRIALGIRFAARKGADVINMSFNFPCGASVPDVDSAIRFAYQHGAVVVASSGNAGVETCISPPATEPHVIAVGGTTETGCPGYYALAGTRLDLVAPGGGSPAAPCVSPARAIVQMTYRSGSLRKFGLPEIYAGTSMAAAHVSGAAAMVIASRVLGADPDPDDVARRLRATARDLGTVGKDPIFGGGLLDAGAATDPEIAKTPSPPAVTSGQGYPGR